MLLQKTMFPVRTAPAQRVEDAEGAAEPMFQLGCRGSPIGPNENIFRPFRAGSLRGYVPGVKTPGLVLSSLWDEVAKPHLGYMIRRCRQAPSVKRQAPNAERQTLSGC